MKKIYFIAIIVLCASCTKTDKFNSSYSLPPFIDSIGFPDFPGITCSIKTDSIPQLITNKNRLPFNANQTPLRLFVHLLNTNGVEVEQKGSDSMFHKTLFIPDPGTSAVNISINYYQGATIRLLNNGLTTTYFFQPNANIFPDPVFTNASITLNPNKNTPLSGLLTATATEPVSISYSVKGQDGEDFTVQQPTTKLRNCRINLFGLYANSNNRVTVTITNAEGSMASKDLWVQTDPLPAAFPDSTDIVVNQVDTANGNTKFILYYPYRTIGSPFNSPGNMSYPIVIDRHGKVRWYMNNPFVLDMKPMPNGHFLQYYYGYLFREIDLMGNIYHEVTPPTNCHHDFQLLPNGNILYTGADLSVNGTDEDKIYEIDYQTGAIVKTFNLYTILDPQRPQQPFITSNDWFHNNSLTFDAQDNSIVLTGRSQSTICKIDYNSGQLKWMISSPDYWKAPLSNYLLQPVGPDFEYTWGQHCVVLNPADHNKLIVFDNGNGRSYTNPLTPPNSYSRIVEFSIDASAKTVTQSFAFGKSYGSENYSPALGSVDYTGKDLFVCFPLVIRDLNGNASDFTGSPGIRFMETDRNQHVVLDISIRNRKDLTKGYRTYRGHPFSFGL
ncbi:MAG: aryl-sulfate sulfotransferase [Bacteroidota bacterium]